MIRIMLCGCHGRMGKMVTACVDGQEDCTVAVGVDAVEAPAPFPVVSSPEQAPETPDVIIDFSHPAALAAELDYAVTNGIPLMLAVTGLSDEQQAAVREAARHIPVFYTGNMSLGINLLAALTKKAAAVLGDSFDVEILEIHHNQKLDAPSGTALMLAKAAEEGLNYTPELTYDRHERRQKRNKKEIGIASLRGGTVVGEHQVMFAGHDEVITLTHRAQSRGVFAAGAVNAARFLIGKAPGLYSMDDMLG